MLRKIIQVVSMSALAVSSFSAEAALNWDSRNPHPFYFGGTVGYGQTTWGQLVPDKPSLAMSLSTPVSASEGGTLWGLYGGYEFVRAFALEASYMRYPNSQIKFSPLSYFSFYHNGRTSFNSKTESASLVAKIMLPLGCTKFRLYSDFGAAGVHRDDVAADTWRLSPTFGAGLNYDFTDRIMLEFGTEYVAGYGQSELEPASDYIPFLYSGFVRAAYRFG